LLEGIDSIKSPVEALIWCCDLGRFPPPELLLSLMDSWWDYVFANGSKSLEEAFIGVSIRKGGNHARRFSSEMQRLWLAILLASVGKEHPGMSQIDFAEFAAKNFEIEINPKLREIFFRIYRKAKCNSG
jgi:hypothetical protein